MFYFILIALFTACNLPTPECNSQDKNSSCYIIPPIIASISSYDSRSIEIEFDNIDFETGDIIIIRESSADTITIYNPESPITNLYPFYRDTKDIVMGQRYDYIIKFIDNEQNESVSADTFITHELAIPDNFSLEQISAAIIGVSWSHTPKIKDSQNSRLGFELVKKMMFGGNIIENTITVNLPVTSDEPAFIISIPPDVADTIYTYIDEEISPFTTYEYKMRTRYTNDDFSDYTSSRTKDLEFPQIETISWYPKNLETISISIIFDDLDYEDVQMSLSRRRDEPENQSDEYEPVFSDYLLQNLDTLNILESPDFNERWEYMLDWWSGSYHDTVYVPIITLPTSNLVYIEGTDEQFNLFDDGGSLPSISPFYVFSTETPDATSSDFGGSEGSPNFLNNNLISPKASISIVEIMEELRAFTMAWYFNPLDAISYSSISAYPMSDAFPDLDRPGFRLLMESEWEYLATNGGSDADYENYSFGGDFVYSSCNAYNPDTPQNASTHVGSFNPSPYGIYDLNGNVWEWCHRNYNNEETENYVLRGGSFENEGYECNNSNRRLISDSYLDDLESAAIGYRMAISAIPFINHLKDIRCSEKEEGYNGCFE